SNTKKEPGLKWTEPISMFRGMCCIHQIPVHHAQGGQAHSTGDKHTDDAISSMSVYVPMRNKVRLNDQVEIPNRPGPVMYVNRPCIIRKITPIVFVDTKLHNDHGNEHP